MICDRDLLRNCDLWEPQCNSQNWIQSHKTENSRALLQSFENCWDILRTSGSFQCLQENFKDFWEVYSTPRKLEPSGKFHKNSGKFWNLQRSFRNCWKVPIGWSSGYSKTFWHSCKAPSTIEKLQDLGNSVNFGDMLKISGKFKPSGRFHLFLGSFEHFWKAPNANEYVSKTTEKFLQVLSSLKNPGMFRELLKSSKYIWEVPSNRWKWSFENSW